MYGYDILLTFFMCMWPEWCDYITDDVFVNNKKYLGYENVPNSRINSKNWICIVRYPVGFV